MLPHLHREQPASGTSGSQQGPGGNGGTHVLPPSSSLRGSLYTDFREGRKWKNLGGGTKFKE